MSFSADLRAFTVKVEARTQDIFNGVVAETQRSIVEGSEITGAPGQPVDIGTLRASWQVWYERPFIGVVATNIVYAPAIEDGVGPYGPLTLRSQVGGWHSVKLTQAGMNRIIEQVTTGVTGGNP